MATDKEIWESGEWSKRRATYASYRAWYDGSPLDESESARDRTEGDLEKRFPLRLNMDKIQCDLHRDIAFGIPPRDDPLAVRAVIERDNNSSSDHLTYLENIINGKIWRASNGGPVQQEAMLSMNIYGDCVFKLSWEPWSRGLPLGLAVRLIRNPSYVLPKWDYLDPWRLLEVYFGYKIDPDVARIKYGISVPDRPTDYVLYMEHWTPKKWSVRVNDQVPTMDYDGKKHSLQGENPYGFVPFYYIPHERTTADSGIGDSQIAHTEGLVKEINARSVTVSDLVRAAKPGTYWATDLRQNPRYRDVLDRGSLDMKILDLGETPPITGARPAQMSSIPMSDIPESIAGWPLELINLWMITGRVSPASFGIDDTRSGRITGPAVAQRMWTSLAHAITERTNFSTGKTILDADILAILANDSTRDDMGEYGIERPDITEDDLRLTIRQVWPPMIPLDEQENMRQFLEMLREGAISLEYFHQEIGVQNSEEMQEQIYDMMERIAKIEAEAKPQPVGGENVNRGQSQGQGVRPRRRTTSNSQ